MKKSTDHSLFREFISGVMNTGNLEFNLVAHTSSTGCMSYFFIASAKTCGGVSHKSFSFTTV